MSHEKINKGTNRSVEYYTPKYIFDAMQCQFDLDVATPNDLSIKINTPSVDRIYEYEDGLKIEWRGFIWMNPPFGNQENKIRWIKKFIEHGNGVALLPDRTSAPWWQYFANHCDFHLQVKGKIKFINPSGEVCKSPSTGTTLFACGVNGIKALENAQKNGLGLLFRKYK